MYSHTWSVNLILILISCLYKTWTLEHEFNGDFILLKNNLPGTGKIKICFELNRPVYTTHNTTDEVMTEMPLNKSSNP